jgi:hypothetical protein
MKKIMVLAILFIPVAVFAENYPGFDQQQMQAMMQKAQEMQACMNNVDQTEMQELERRGKLLEVEVKKLCASGRRSEAQSKAIAFTKEFANSSSMKEVQKCGEMAKEIMSAFPKVAQSSENNDAAGGHICDHLD